MSRIFKAKRRVRVGDCDTQGRLRIDAIARYLQDIGYDDTNDLGLGDGGIWVARAIEIVNTSGSEENWPFRNQIVNLETYCGGVGKVVAQRNVNIYNDGVKAIETKTLWVSLDQDSKISPVPTWLKETYSDAVNVSSKRILSLKPEDEESIMEIKFPLRQSDLDINDHANNSLAFDALFEASSVIGVNDFSRVYIEYHTPIDIADDTAIQIVKKDNAFLAWLRTANHVACSMLLES